MVIPSFPKYEASTYGRIRNARTKHVLRPQWNTSGYLKVHLGRGCQQLVQRLVCEAFHGAPSLPSDHADHWNFDRTDNRPSNLRWLPARDNLKRKLAYMPHGWQVGEGDEPPEGYTELTPAERAEAEADLIRNGW